MYFGSGHEMKSINSLLTFWDELSVGVCDLREHVSQLVHELAAGQHRQRHLDGEHPEPAGLVLAVGEHQPGGEQARGRVRVDVLTRGQSLVQAGVERGEERLHAGAVHEGARLQGVEPVLPEGLDHVPDVDVVEEGSPLDVAQLGRRPVGREPDVVMLLERVVQRVQLRVALPVVVGVVVARAVVHGRVEAGLLLTDSCYPAIAKVSVSQLLPFLFVSPIRGRGKLIIVVSGVTFYLFG